MSIQKVDLVDYPRNLLQDGDVCPFCLETPQNDEGKAWVAHLNITHPDATKKTELVHHVHRKCEMKVLEVSSLCFMRDVELNLIHSPEELKAKRIKILSMIVGGTTNWVVSLAGMVGVTLVTDLLMKEIILQSFPTILFPGFVFLPTIFATGVGIALNIASGEDDIIPKIVIPLVGLIGAGTTQLVRIQKIIVELNGEEMAPSEYQTTSELTLGLGLALSMGVPGGLLLNRIGKWAGNYLKNVTMALFKIENDVVPLEQ